MRREWLSTDYSTGSHRAQGGLTVLIFVANRCRVILQGVEIVNPRLRPKATIRTALIFRQRTPGGNDPAGAAGEAEASPIDLLRLPERRKSSRFPFREDLQYRVAGKRGGYSAGVGLSLDMSSCGIRFSTLEQIAIGSTVQVSVSWPARLGGICPLKVVAQGRIVRSDAHWAALSIQRYEFRTRGSGVAQPTPVLHAGTQASG
jgi:hypothetical protein